MLARVKALGRYVWARLNERSTFGDLAVAIGQVAVVPPPWCWAMGLLLLAKAFVADGALKK